MAVRISEFSRAAIEAGEPGAPGAAAATMVRAVRLYLGDRDSNKPGWAYPPILRDRAADGVELELDVDEDLWHDFEEEAAKQDVTVSQLSAHVALYYAAELDSGRIAQRVLDSAADGDADDA